MPKRYKRPPYDPSRGFTVRKRMRCPETGRHLNPGDPYEWRRYGVDRRRLELLWRIRYIECNPPPEEPKPKKRRGGGRRKQESKPGPTAPAGSSSKGQDSEKPSSEKPPETEGESE